jgi:hypothetical protein
MPAACEVFSRIYEYPYGYAVPGRAICRGKPWVIKREHLPYCTSLTGWDSKGLAVSPTFRVEDQTYEYVSLVLKKKSTSQWLRISRSS